MVHIKFQRNKNDWERNSDGRPRLQTVHHHVLGAVNSVAAEAKADFLQAFESYDEYHLRLTCFFLLGAFSSYLHAAGKPKFH